MNEQQNRVAGLIVALGATITAAMDDVPGFVPCGTPTQVILSAISAVEKGDESELAQQEQTLGDFIQHVAGHRGVTPHDAANLEHLTPEQQQTAQRVRDFAATANAAKVTPETASKLYRDLASLEA